MADTLPRRSFLAVSGAGLGSAWIAAQWPVILTAACDARRAASEGAPFRILSPEQAAEVEAIAAGILPSGPDGLGAKEAGVVHFVDRALDTFLASQADGFRSGLEEFRAAVRSAHPSAGSFAALPEAARTAFLESVQDGPFFGQVWFLTVLGAFADPSYGGNRDKVGWRLLGFEDRHVWQPPFGWYDREAHGG